MSRNSLRIGIDINEANVAVRVGSNQYAYEIIRALYAIDKVNTYTLYASKSVVRDMPPERFNWQYKVIPPAKLWTQWRLPLQLMKDQSSLDVFYSPGHYAPRYSPIPTVVTVMDVAYLMFPDFFRSKDVRQLTSWTKYSVGNAKKVITISENTKKDIQKHYKRAASDITVAYPGYDHKNEKISQEKMDKSLSRYNIPAKYILYIGTFQPRKNLRRLISAFENLPKTSGHLVLGGKLGWMHDEIMQAIALSPKKDMIHAPGFIEDYDLPAIYAAAQCLVLPGLYEGFGMPPLEAIAHGTIPVVSHTGSLPEVVGEGGILCDPYDPISIGNAITNAIKLASKEKKDMLHDLDMHIRKFAWKSSAKKIIKVLHEVATQG